MGVGGLFASQTRSHRGPGRQAIAARRKRSTAALDRFADLLAEHDLETGDKGGDIRLCALRLNVSYSYANAMLQRIKKRLGRQAI